MHTRTFLAGWGDMDFNSHMRNTAYLDKSADMRLQFFAENGFSADTFAQRRFGPVMRKDEIEYFREIGLLEEIRGSLLLAGLSEDGSRFRMRNEFHRGDGQLAARVSSLGGWLDLNQRCLVAPPAELLAAMRQLTPSDDFETLPSSLK